MGNSDLLIIIKMTDRSECKILVKGINYSSKRKAILKAVEDAMCEIDEHNRKYDLEESHAEIEARQLTKMNDDIKEIKIYELP